MDVVFDFPNLRTRWTPQLREQVAALRGVRAVRVEQAAAGAGERRE